MSKQSVLNQSGESIGVLYVVAGDRKYLEEALFSAKTLKLHNPRLPVVIYTPWKGLRSKFVDRFFVIEPADHPLKNKPAGILLSPYQVTLYLDSDTQVRGDLMHLFDDPVSADVAIANECLADWTTPGYPLIELRNPLSYNTGVILFRHTPAGIAFLNEWLRRTSNQESTDMWPGHNGDQRHFREIVNEGYLDAAGGKLLILDNCLYNVRPQMVSRLTDEHLLGSALIYHFRGGPPRPIVSRIFSKIRSIVQL